MKYVFSLTSAVATAQFAVYKLVQGATPGFFACQTFLSVIVFVATVLLYLTMLQNRLYFVYIARQLNSIRGHLMLKEASGFAGNQLLVNFETHGDGSIQVELLDVSGKPIPGYTLREALSITGDELERVVAWKGKGTDLAPLAGKPIRLRFVMKDADLYALRFAQ